MEKDLTTGIEEAQTTKQASGRVDEIDILKGIAIILMVTCHAGAPFSQFVYLFHMAVFFIASGYFYKDKYSNDIGGLFNGIKQKIKGLYVPFVLWNTFFVLLHNLFINVNVYSDNPSISNYIGNNFVNTTNYYDLKTMGIQVLKGMLFSSKEQLLGAYWFIKVLFVISVTYMIVDYFIRKFNKRKWCIQGFISIGLLATGFYCSIKGITVKELEIVCSCYILYFFGNILGDNHLIQIGHATKGLIVVFFSTVLLLFFCKFGSISLGSNKYVNPFFFMAASLAGWALLINISSLLQKVTSGLKNVLIYVGKNSLTIMLFHFLAFKIVTVLVVVFAKLPLFCIAAFPNLYGDKYSLWVAYSLAGVLVPLSCKRLCTQIFSHFLNKQ